MNKRDLLFKVLCDIRQHKDDDIKMLDHLAHTLKLDNNEKQSCLYLDEVSTEELAYFIHKKLSDI